MEHIQFSESLAEMQQRRREITAAKEEQSGLHFVNERQEIIQAFTDRINETRDLNRFNEATWSQINGQLRSYTVADLKRFYRKCREGSSFGRVFWGTLKQRRRP